MEMENKTGYDLSYRFLYDQTNTNVNIQLCGHSFYFCFSWKNHQESFAVSDQMQGYERRTGKMNTLFQHF